MVSPPWPPSSSLCLSRLVAVIAPLWSALCMIRSPSILGQPSWLVLASAAALGATRARASSGISRRIGTSLLAQALRLGLVERELARHRAVVTLARPAPAHRRRRRVGRIGRRRRQRRLGTVRGAQAGAG